MRDDIQEDIGILLNPEKVVEDYMGWVAIVHQRLRGWASY
jgi:hypothetical protein